MMKNIAREFCEIEAKSLEELVCGIEQVYSKLQSLKASIIDPLELEVFN